MDFQISIAACSDYEAATCQKALLEVLAPLGGLDWVRAGMHIVIKANLVSFLKPEAAATTHPQLLCSLVQLLTQRGARVTIGDSPGGLYNAAYVNHVYRATGMTQVQKAGAHLNEDFSQATATFPQGLVLKSFQYTRYLDDADVIINFCKLKTHGMMGMSAGAKNLFGTIPGTIKPEYHFRFSNPADFARMIVDLNNYFHPALTICDGVTAMEGNGPTMGTPRHMGVLLASKNPHALDLACAKLIGLTRDQVPTLQAAFERGYIPEDVEGLTVYGNLQAFCVQDFALMPSLGSIQFQATSGHPLKQICGRIIQKAMCSKPLIQKEKCSSCHHCQTICPAKAISFQNAFPKINRKLCIHCFCCQEFCPQGAIQVHRPAIAKMLGGTQKTP